MTVEFWDLEGRSTSRQIDSSDELTDCLASFVEREPFYCEFVNGEFKLSVCIRRDLGSVQYSRADNAPPYMMAVNSAQVDQNEEVDFFIGNEATSLLARYALPCENVNQIIQCFFETGQNSPAVPWEEI